MPKRRAVECAVCVEATPASKLVVCPFCEFSACKACFARVLLDGSEEAHCMSCKRAFDREMLIALTSAHFVNTQYKAFREDVLFEREQAMVPATMPYVELERDARAARARLDELQRERRRLRQRIVQINDEMVTQQLIAMRRTPNADAVRSFTQRCPKEGCRGWLNSAYRCGVCSDFSCPRCLAPCGAARADVEAHVCRPGDVESVAAIRSDSTPCPSCGIRVSKVDGCNQMWCVSCHCAFDYRSGQRVHGAIHNPHWMLYQQQHAASTLRDPADIPCGAMPTVGELLAVGAATHTLMNAMRIVRHLETVDIPRLWTRADLRNRPWRVLFILGEVSERAFKSRVQRQDKVDAKNRECVQVLEMVCHTVTDELRQVAVRAKARDGAERAVLSLVEYANRALNTIAARYGQVTPRLIVYAELAWRVSTRGYQTAA